MHWINMGLVTSVAVHGEPAGLGRTDWRVSVRVGGEQIWSDVFETKERARTFVETLVGDDGWCDVWILKAMVER